MESLVACNEQPPASARSIPSHAARAPRGREALAKATRCDAELYAEAKALAARIPQQSEQLYAQLTSGRLRANLSRIDGLAEFAVPMRCYK